MRRGFLFNASSLQTIYHLLCKRSSWMTKLDVKQMPPSVLRSKLISTFPGPGQSPDRSVMQARLNFLLRRRTFPECFSILPCMTNGDVWANMGVFMFSELHKLERRLISSPASFHFSFYQYFFSIPDFHQCDTRKGINYNVKMN